jgi:hypothetical protein
MKNILKQTAILLILAGSLVSCGKDEDEMKEIPLEYEECPCEHGGVTNVDVTENGILMFDVSLTSPEEIATITRKGVEDTDEIIPWVTVDFASEQEAARLYRGIYSAYLICNFPKDIIKSGDIPHEGILISLKGKVTCDRGGYDTYYYELSLTSLKIQTK